MTVRSRFVLALVGGAVLAIVLAAPALARWRSVTKRTVSFPHFRSIQGAVDAASPGDTIVIAPAATPGR